MKRLTWILIFWIGLHYTGSGQTGYCMPKQVERIVFLGNSITYSGQYVDYVETILTAEYPDRRFEIINIGLPSETVSGLSEPNHAGGRFPRPDLHERLERILDQLKPDLVFACYGMNDGIYMPLDESRFEKFREGMKWLHKEVVGSGASIVHLTPPVYDERRGEEYARVLDVYADWLISCRDKEGWDVIDIHGPMKNFMELKRKTNPAFKYAEDGVHPDEKGHWIMARSILLALGVKGVTEAESMEEAMSVLKINQKLLKPIAARQQIRKDAWLTTIGHKRPGMNKGLPLKEAQTKALEFEKEINDLAFVKSADQTGAQTSFVKVHKAVKNEVLSEEYTVTVNGKAVPVYKAAVSDHYSNSPLQMDESYSFSGFECTGTVDVVIRSNKTLSALTVRSNKEEIQAKIQGKEAKFTLQGNGNYLIERNGNGRKDPLLLFANSREKNVPDKNDPNVIYFGPGRHDPGLISLTTNQSLYIDAGAIVFGRVEAKGENIRICGRGILENSGDDYKWKYMILLDSCKNVRVEGLILRKNARGWTLVPKNCDQVNISNVKILGSHSFNDDGIDPVNTKNLSIENCVIRTNDDCLAFKGMDDNRSHCENIRISNCMLWSDQCCTILLGDECRADFMRNIVIRDCFVPYLSYEGYPKKFLMMHSGEEMKMENIRIEDIEIGGEGQERNFIEMTCEFNQYSKTERAGHIRNVQLKNIHLRGAEGAYNILIKGYDKNHRVESVLFDNCTINGKPITSSYPGLKIGKHTAEIRFK